MPHDTIKVEQGNQFHDVWVEHLGRTEKQLRPFGSGKGTREKIQDHAYLAQFDLDPQRQLIGSICSGALLLAALGLLEGKRATTYPSAKRLLEQYGVEVIEKPIVVEGNVATAGGCLAGQYLAAWVIERLVGREVAEAVLTSCQPVGEGLSFEAEVELIPPARCEARCATRLLEPLVCGYPSFVSEL